MASTTEVLLTSNVLKLGSMGDIVRVKAGYARNYLFPEGKAIPASAAAKRQIEVLQERARKADLEAQGQALAQKKDLDGMAVRIPAKVAHGTHLFGSVGIREIVAKLAEHNVKVDPRQVHLHENFKELGRYEVLVKLHSAVEATITVEVVDADPTGKSLDEVIEEVDASTVDESAEQA